MAKNLIIVESPAKAKTIKKYLGTAYKVEASMGHVRDLPKSKLGVNVEDNFTPEYITMVKKRKIASALKKAAKGVGKIYLAADPDREGEAICWHLESLLQKSFKGEIKRVAFNEITPNAVREAFLHPREIDSNLVNAQQARRILDRIVGYKLSPLLWKKVARGLSAGRVQSVALKIIIDREREIRAFIPQEYWSIEVELSPKTQENSNKLFRAKLEKIDGQKVDLKNQDITNNIVSELERASFSVKDIIDKQRQRKPQPPFITSKLQQEAYSKLKFPAQKTMRLAQSLYEGVSLGDEGSVGLITYMRTDSVNVSKTAISEVRGYIENNLGKEFLPNKENVYKSRKRAQEAHEAIRPSSVERTPSAMKQYLSEDEFKLYSLIWKRFVASQMNNAKDVIRSIDIVADEKYIFRTSTTQNIFPGFTKVYDITAQKKADAETSEDGRIYEHPVLTIGELLNLINLLPQQHFTKAPPRYNDASIVKTMEELGIGRPSTYAPTIQTIIDRSYIERQSGALCPTEMGELVIDLLVEHFSYLLEAGFTAKMEESLDNVEDGNEEWTNLLKDFYSNFAKHLEQAQEKMQSVKRAQVATDYVCDVCAKPMVMKWGRFGKFLACSDFPDCKFTKSIPTGFLCPQDGCDGELIRRQSKTGRAFFGCSNYPKCTYLTNKLPEKEEESSEDSNKES